MRLLHTAVSLIVSLSIVGAAVADTRVLTNDDVIKLVKLNLGDDVVVAKVNQAPQIAFSLDTNDLASLKASGVDGRVIAAMLDRAARDRAPAKPTPVNIGVNS